MRISDWSSDVCSSDLLPLLFVGRRIARPLSDLTRSAEQFAIAGAAQPVEERGPGDVRRLITAFNAMRARLLAMLDEKDRMLGAIGHDLRTRSEEHTSEIQSLMRISYAVFCLKKKNKHNTTT